eukprot:15684083-Heterocapsa_arctica.AAC.1
MGLHRRGRDRNAFPRFGDRRAGRSRWHFFLRRDGDRRVERLAVLVLEDLACGVEECGLVVLRRLAVFGQAPPGRHAAAPLVDSLRREQQ